MEQGCEVAFGRQLQRGGSEVANAKPAEGLRVRARTILPVELGLGRAAWTRLRLGRVTPHGIQARTTRHVGRPVEPLVAQALVKPGAIAIAGLQIRGQAPAV